MGTEEELSVSNPHGNVAGVGESAHSCFASLVKDAMTFSSVRRLHSEEQSGNCALRGWATGVCTPFVDEGAFGPSRCLACGGLAPGEIDQAQSACSHDAGTMHGVVSRLDCLPARSFLVSCFAPPVGCKTFTYHLKDRMGT